MICLMPWPGSLRVKTPSWSWITRAQSRMTTSTQKGKIEISKWKMPVKVTGQIRRKTRKVVAIRTEIEIEMKEEEKTRMNQEEMARTRVEVITKVPEVELVDKETKEIEVIETETIKMTMLTIMKEVTSARRRKRDKQGRDLQMIMQNTTPGAHRMTKTRLIIDPELQNHQVAEESQQVMSTKQELQKIGSKTIDPEMMITARKLQAVEAVDEEEASEMTINTLKMIMTIIIRNKSLTCGKLGGITPTTKRVKVKVVVRAED